MKYFKFGFEYECFIEVKSEYVNFILEQLLSKKIDFNYLNDYLPKNSYSNSDSNSDSEEEMFWRIVRRDDTDSIDMSNAKTRIQRFLIASFLNTVDPEYQFKVSPKYSQEPIHIFPLFPHNQVPKKIVYWSITSDSSVKKDMCENPFYKNSSDGKTFTIKNCEKIIDFIEFVSPILKWDDIKSNDDKTNVIGYTLNKILPCKGEFDYLHNNKTSNHVHISRANSFQEENNVVKICIAWWYFEPIILSFVKKWRYNSEYAKSLNTIIENTIKNKKMREYIFFNLNEDNFKQVLPYDDGLNFFTNIFNLFQGINYKSGKGKHDRNAGLNLLNLPYVPTVEIRLKEGSTNNYDITMFIKFLAYFLDAICKNKSITTKLNDAEKIQFWYVKKSGRKHFMKDMWNHLFKFMNRKDYYEKDFLNVFGYWKNKTTLFS